MTGIAPTPEMVRAVFERLLKGKEYRTLRQRGDAQGLYLWDITVPGKDGDTEYSYMREGRYPEGEASATAVHVIFSDKAGNPAGGHSVAKYTGEGWQLTP